MTRRSAGAAATAISLTAYAKLRGVSTVAVSKAIAAGRLTESVVKVGGKPKIADVELADREWMANTRPRVDHPPAPSRPPRPRMPSPSRSPAEMGDDDDEGAAAQAAEAGGVPNYNTSRAVREAHAARREAALADLAEIEVAEKHEELVPVGEVRKYITDKFTVVKTRLLGVPSGVAQQLPNLAAEIVPVIDSLIREALEELAVDDEDGEEEDDEAA